MGGARARGVGATRRAIGERPARGVLRGRARTCGGRGRRAHGSPGADGRGLPALAPEEGG